MSFKRFPVLVIDSLFDWEPVSMPSVVSTLERRARLLDGRLVLAMRSIADFSRRGFQLRERPQIIRLKSWVCTTRDLARLPAIPRLRVL